MFQRVKHLGVFRKWRCLSRHHLCKLFVWKFNELLRNS